MNKRIEEIYHYVMLLEDCHNPLYQFAELVEAAARKDEREANIKLLEDFSKTAMVPAKDTWRMGLIAGANAIRGRTE